MHRPALEQGAHGRAERHPTDGPHRRLPARGGLHARALRSPEVAARVGLWLGICFTRAFADRRLSATTPAAVDQPIPFPTRPVWGYRVTQGLHSLSGTAAVPLLLVKLWAVYPKLFAACRGADRAAASCTCSSGLSIGCSSRRRSSSSPPGSPTPRSGTPGRSLSAPPTTRSPGWPSGRWSAHRGQAAGHPRPRSPGPIDDARPARAHGRRDPRAALVRTTLAARPASPCSRWRGGTVPWLRRVSVFERPRSGDGPAGVPINKCAAAAGVSGDGHRPGVPPRGRARRHGRVGCRSPTSRPCRSRPRRCRSPASRGGAPRASWTGVRLRDLLDLVGAPARRRRRGDVAAGARAPSGSRPAAAATSPTTTLTLLALGLARRAAGLDHGYPCRLIAPEPARACCRPSGSPGWRCRREALRRAAARVASASRARRRTASGCSLPRQDPATWSRRRVWLAGGVVRARRRAGAAGDPGRRPRRCRALPGWAGRRPRSPARGARHGDTAGRPGARPVRREAPTTRRCWTVPTWRCGWCSPALVVVVVRESPPCAARRRRGERPMADVLVVDDDPPCARWWSPTCAPAGTRSPRPADGRGRAAAMRDAAAPTWSCST